MAASSGPLFVLVAGERSGDALGAGLMQGLRAHYPRARFAGVAGPLMRAAGCEAMADVDELSLFGISEVLAEIPRLLRLRRRLFEYARAECPAAFIGIDAPSFNMPLEVRLKKLGITTVHYVCPTAWAWRAGRTRGIRRAVDLMLAIFPFEEAFFKRHGVPVTFVGHPLAGERPLHQDAGHARQALALPVTGALVGLLPGSRRSEVSRLAPRFLLAAGRLAQRRPDVRFVAPAASPGMRTLIEAAIAAHAPELDVRLIDGRSREAMQAADALLLASGTATLEALLAKTPMIVSYVLSPMNYWVVRGLNLVKTKYVSMPNLLAGYEIVPELLQQEAVPEIMAERLHQLLQSPSARTRQIEAFESISRRLGGDADARAAQAVIDLLESR